MRSSQSGRSILCKGLHSLTAAVLSQNFGRDDPKGSTGMQTTSGRLPSENFGSTSLARCGDSHNSRRAKWHTLRRDHLTWLYFSQRRDDHKAVVALSVGLDRRSVPRRLMKSHGGLILSDTCFHAIRAQVHDGGLPMCVKCNRSPVLCH